MTEPRRTRLRADAEAILRAGIAGAAPAPLVEYALRYHEIESPVRLLAVGKAAAGMARAAYAQVPVRSALVIAPEPDEAPWPDPAPALVLADHPIPRQRSVDAARAAQGFLQRSVAGDTVLVLLSGGSSALATLPAPGLTLHDLAATTRALLASGASIQSLNCVRRHLDDVKGGRLARLAAPAAVICLALSDVPGDDPAVIGSGPFSPDATTFGMAIETLQRHDVLGRVPKAVLRHLEAGARGEVDESLKPGDAAFRHVRYQIIGSNRNARDAAAAEAASRGYVTEQSALWLTGEAREVGQRLGGELAAQRIRHRKAVIFGGETTVTVHGPGAGGRNQELALAAAGALADVPGVALGAVGTDGIDGASPAAGAIVDGVTDQVMRALGIDPERALAENDSYRALAAAGAALVTGPTGTNVMDITVTLALP